jgi:hypothetical protein
MMRMIGNVISVREVFSEDKCARWETASAVNEVTGEAREKQRPMRSVKAGILVVIVNLFLPYASFQGAETLSVLVIFCACIEMCMIVKLPC